MKKIFTILSLVAISSFAMSQELLTNPGFESGYTTWAKGPTASYTDPVLSTTDFHSGTNSVGYAGVTATTGFYQNVNITAGKTYVISFWYKSSGDGTDSRLWSVYKTAVGGTAVYTTVDATTDAFRTNNGYLPSAAAWTQYTAEMPAGATSTILETAVRVYSAGTAQFDDFSVKEKIVLGTVDVNFNNQIKMNTIVRESLNLRLPYRSTVNIYSIDGKLVSSNRVSDGGSINTSSLQKGNYIVTVEDGTNKISRKIIKE